MPPKAADKKPAASKAPATASKAPEKKDAGKKTAASGDKKKRTKARKETYSSYIYKGELYHDPSSRNRDASFGLVFLPSSARSGASWQGVGHFAPHHATFINNPSHRAWHSIADMTPKQS